MPFTFKLSKRLALLKISLAAGAFLALACDRPSPAAPEAVPYPLTQLVSSLSTTSVVASGDDGNVPRNTLDRNLATRWSAQGDGQWIRYDLGSLRAVHRVDIAWYRGNEWESAFDLEVSPDAVSWTRVFGGRSSGRTLERERYDFSTVSARYLRITGHGQWSGATRLSLWNSITEVDIYDTALPVQAVTASGDDGNVPANTLDRSLATRWSAHGDGQWIRFDLGATATVGRLDVAWYRGNEWQSAFDIEVSSDAVGWTRVFSGRSSGTTLEPERYEFAAVAGRYVRITGHGQWNGSTRSSWWNSITEVAIGGPGAPPPAATLLPVAAVLASGDDGNVPKNTLDKDLATRWSANGDGQWIRFDLGTATPVSRLDIAWYRGNEWESVFEIEVSPDAVGWTRVFSGRSSGKTLEREGYAFPAIAARYVRITGHGQWSGSTRLSLWNSITEVDVWGSGPAGPAPVASVSVSPASAGLLVGQTAQLAATVLDAFGNPLADRLVTWSTSNGAVAPVSPTGLVNGLTTGTATITASSDGVSGTAAVAVRVPSNPGTVTDLAVVAVADTGVTLAFTEVDDGTGLAASYDVRAGVAPITWGSGLLSVTRGTCATPLAGAAVGNRRTCTVLGLQPGTTYEFQLVAFRGTLTVDAVFGGLSNVARATTTAPPTTDGLGPQPGPGATIIVQDGFESGDLGLWEQIPNTGRYSITTDAARVKSGARALQTLYTPTNGYGMLTRWFMPGVDEVYVRFYVLFEDGFANLREDGHGMHFFVLAGNRIDDSRSSFGKAGVKPNGTDFFYAGLDPEYVYQDPTLRPFEYYTYWPDMTCCYGNHIPQTAPKTALVGGQWQEVVFHLKLNTPGQADGSQTVWLNGVKKLDMQNLRWRTTTDLRLNQIRFDNYMPGGPRTQYLWIDDVTVWRP